MKLYKKFNRCPGVSDAERFWEKVYKAEDTHWYWLGAADYGGYGIFTIGGKNIRTHQWSYISKHGGIPQGLEIDHLCRVRACVRPDHLEAVTHEENVRRTPRAMATRCVNGHEFDGKNTRISGRGHRVCGACQSKWNRNYLDKKGSVL